MELAKLSKNQFEEIERRCIGVTHPTCTQLTSESYKNIYDFLKSSCEAQSARNAYAGGTDMSAECRTRFGYK